MEEIQSAIDSFFEMIRMLLNHPRIHLSSRGDKGMLTAIRLGVYDVIDLLIEDGRMRKFPLCMAVESNYAPLIHFVLDQKFCDPSQNDDFALRTCASNGNVEIVARLMADSRVNPTSLDNYALRACERRKDSSSHNEIARLLMNDWRVASLRDALDYVEKEKEATATSEMSFEDFFSLKLIFTILFADSDGDSPPVDESDELKQSYGWGYSIFEESDEESDEDVPKYEPNCDNLLEEGYDSVDDEDDLESSTTIVRTRNRIGHFNTIREEIRFEEKLRELRSKKRKKNSNFHLKQWRIDSETTWRILRRVSKAWREAADCVFPFKEHGALERAASANSHHSIRFLVSKGCEITSSVIRYACGLGKEDGDVKCALCEHEEGLDCADPKCFDRKMRSNRTFNPETIVALGDTLVMENKRELISELIRKKKSNALR